MRNKGLIGHFTHINIPTHRVKKKKKPMGIYCHLSIEDQTLECQRGSYTISLPLPFFEQIERLH